MFCLWNTALKHSGNPGCYFSLKMFYFIYFLSVGLAKAKRIMVPEFVLVETTMGAYQWEAHEISKQGFGKEYRIIIIN